VASSFEAGAALSVALVVVVSEVLPSSALTWFFALARSLV
jgi:hypothetical protein